MKNLGTLGAVATFILLLGNCLSFNPILSGPAWKMVGFIAGGIVAFACLQYFGRRFESPAIGFFAGGVVMFISFLIVGALT